MVYINAVNLFENFVDVAVKYGGLIPEIPPDIDPTGRTDLLKVLDHGKKEGHICEPESTAIQEDAVLGMNAYSIRIISKLDPQDELLCAPIHMLASVGFVRDEQKNIVAMKIGEVGGNRDISDLAVLYCATSEVAESICQTLEQCFDLVFSETNHQLLAKKMSERAPAHSDSFADSQSASASSTSRQRGTEGLSFMTGSTQQLNRAGTKTPGGARGDVPVGGQSPDGGHHRNVSTTTSPSGSDRVSQSTDLIQEYMRTLYVHLSPAELKQFAVLLKRWTSEGLPFAEFVQKVLELYGAERKHLLARMRPFAPEVDVAYFDNFLELSGITENAESSLASYSPASDSLYSRSTGGTTTFDRSSDWNSLRTMPLPPPVYRPPPPPTTALPAHAHTELVCTAGSTHANQNSEDDTTVEEHRL